VARAFARAARQLALGVGVGLTVAVGPDQLSGGVLLNGTGLLLVPATAAFMLVVDLLAAAGPARRGLRVRPTEALRAPWAEAEVVDHIPARGNGRGVRPRGVGGSLRGRETVLGGQLVAGRVLAW
jgi:hypothetical protein